MPKYRKKPVVVDAVQFNGEMSSELVLLIANKEAYLVGGGIALDVYTLEGVMRASQGDWIIKGVQGEIYPCKPDIFAEIYDPA